MRESRESIRTYRDLEVWRRGMDLVEHVYRLTRAFPRDDLFQLTSQIRRAAVSIPSNIAEGHGRTGTQEYLHHLSIAHGSLAETETQVQIAVRLGYVKPQECEALMEATASLSMMLRALMKKLRART